MKRKTKKQKRPTPRRVWRMNPRTRVKPSGKRYRRVNGKKNWLEEE